MAMRDPKEMAREWMARVAGHPDDYDETGVEQVATLIREAQEDGARAEREKRDEGAIDANEAREIVEKYFAHVPPDGVSTADVIRSMCAEHARSGLIIAALTERAERAEEEANNYNELLAETCEKLDSAEYERDEAVKALDIHKERADRAESELHRRKF